MDAQKFSKISLLLLVAAISSLFFSMIKAFIMALIMAGIFSAMSQPLYKKLTKAFGGRKRLGALTTLTIIVLVILVPLVSLTGIVTGEAVKVANGISPWVQDKAENPHQITLWLEKQPFYSKIAPYEGAILSKAGQVVSTVSKFLVASLSGATAGTAQFFFMLMIMLYAMYFFIMDGYKLLDRILYYLPLRDDEERVLLDKFTSVTRATLKGTAVIGLVQGSLAGLAFWVVGIPSPIFWGTIMTLLSIIPGIGTVLIWGPAAVLLIAGGSVAKGVGLALFCGMIVGSIDNVLRPRLVGQDTKMPDLMIMVGTLGGITMFGILGFIIGPIVAALFISLWEIYGTVFSDVLPPRRAPSDET